MALDNYDNLKASIIRWMGRNDLADLADDFIDIAESRMYANPIANLRLRSMETRSTASTVVGERFIALPDDYLEQRRLKYDLTNKNDVDLEFRTPDQLNLKDGNGRPCYFTVTSQFEFERPFDEIYTIEIQHFKRLTALSDANTSNDILTNYPDIYLYGSLWAAKQYASEEEEAEYFYNKFIESIAGANEQDMMGRYGPAPVVRSRNGRGVV